MAKYNEILVGRYNRYFQKLFQMKGEAPAPQLSAEIQTSLALKTGVETAVLEGWNVCGFQVAHAAVAGQTSAVRLRNPSAVNVVAVVELVHCFSDVATDVLLSVSTAVVSTDLANVGFGVPYDIRAGAGSRAALIPSDGNGGAGVGVNTIRKRLAALTNVDWIITDLHEIPLPPGGAIELTTGTVNSNFTVSYRWRERYLEESER